MPAKGESSGMRIRVIAPLHMWLWLALPGQNGQVKIDLVVIMAMMPSKIPEGETRGWIVPLGGAENKENDRRILERFILVSGGEDADIVVIPTASRMHETGPRYEGIFKELGARQ